MSEGGKSPAGFAELLKRAAAKAVKDMEKTAQAKQSGFCSGKAVESPNFQTAEADDKSSIIQGRLMVDWIPADRLGQALVYVQKSAGLRSLEEIADEIGLLLTLTAEQDSDSLALKKLKQALTRKQLIQAQAEVATLHKAVREAMGDSVWRWDF